jgi:decaprenylphospho-beta-D-erythro-pentofuranosid-2-ulose 2-reductase
VTLDRAWLVLGGSSAIARAFARVAAEAGSDVILAGRDLEDLERTARDLSVRFDRRAEAIAFDATDLASHAGFVERVRARARMLDVMLAFGLMPNQAAIDADPALGMQTMAATYTGAASVLLHLAPVLEAQGEGRVVVIGSVAGDRGRLKNYVYGSAKAGLHAFAQGLRARLFRAGVQVTTVKPGFIDTAMTFGMKTGPLVASPEACARACLRLARRGREVAYYPPIWRIVMLIIKLIPEPLMKRMSF